MKIDNPKKIYHHKNTDLPNDITGITHTDGKTIESSQQATFSTKPSRGELMSAQVKITLQKIHIIVFATILFCLNINNIHAQTGSICNAFDVEYKDPIKDEWIYALVGAGPGGSASSVEELMADLQSRLSGQECTPKPYARMVRL